MRTLTMLTLLLLPAAGLLADDKPAPGKQVEQKYAAEDDKTLSARYLFFLPKDYKADGKKWPLIYFLHGRGESYGELSLVKKWGPPQIVETNAEFPFIVVSPQCPGAESWPQARQQKILAGLLAEVAEKYNVDESRVYLTGLSMGGYGSWTLAAAHPEKFAAVVPICGGGNPEDAEKLKNLPIWVFHGEQDRAVPIRRSQQMVDAIRKAGGKKIRFTTLEHFGHNSWSAAYHSPELYQWLKTQKTAADE